MQHTQLISLLKSFSTDELKQLRLFVISPFFNKSQDSPILLDFAIEIIEKEKQKPIIDPETETEKQKLARNEAEKNEAEQHYIEAYRRLNPKKAKGTPKEVIVKKMQPLLSLAEQFIEHNLLKNGIDQSKHASTTQLEYYVVRALENKFENEYAKVENERADVVTKNAHYHLKNFEIAEILGAYNTRYNDRNKADEPNLESISEELDTFYLAKKTEYLCHCYNRMRTVKVEYALHLEKELLSYLPQSHFFQKPVIKIWYDTLLLLKTPTEALHTQLKNSIVDAANCLSSSEKQIIFTLLSNTIINIYKNETSEKRYREYFNLYKLQLQYPDALYLDGYLDPKTFRNFGIIAMRLNELQWAEDFINSHDGKLSPANADSQDTYNLIKAELAFAKKDYAAAEDFLMLVKGENIGLKIDERRIRLKLYYETNSVLFEGTVKSHRKFLSVGTKTIESSYVKQNREFVTFADKLFAAKTEHVLYGQVSKYPLQQLDEKETKINEEPLVSDRLWLLEKVQELKNRLNK